MKTMQISVLKPRNPLVAAARMRKAGAHRLGGGAIRQRERLAMQRELEHAPPRKP
jgi:hypothetical protein